mmetsp:Transcript_74967/g.199912  ORF Transcript_74967/g.199912 Transcript_74967/m.199912 type:complete len:115 (-) Transcript_74967:2919-3263(-)
MLLAWIVLTHEPPEANGFRAGHSQIAVTLLETRPVVRGFGAAKIPYASKTKECSTRTAQFLATPAQIASKSGTLHAIVDGSPGSSLDHDPALSMSEVVENGEKLGCTIVCYLCD